MMISLSITSHGQFELVKNLLDDIEKYCIPESINTNNTIEIILTINIPEELPTEFTYSFPLKIIRNMTPKGFGANHNQAFLESSGEYFCVLNPDIRLLNNPFPELIKHNTGVTAPQIIDESGHIQDSAREFLTPLRLLKRIFNKFFKKSSYKNNINIIHPDWVAGMFMVLPKKIYKAINGFDERYYLYCEDMDICWRLRKKGYEVTLDKNTKAIHAAQRDSHKKLKYLYWHVKSLFIFFFYPHP